MLTKTEAKQEAQDEILRWIVAGILCAFEQASQVHEIPDKNTITYMFKYARSLMKQWGIQEFHGLGGLDQSLEEIVNSHFPE